MLGRHKKDEEQKKFGIEFEKSFILPNHDEIMNIIESHAHHVGNNHELLNEINKYTRHIAVYKALHAIGDLKDPYNMDEELGWPDNFYKVISKKTLELQKEYEQLMTINDL